MYRGHGYKHFNGQMLYCQVVSYLTLVSPQNITQISTLDVSHLQADNTRRDGLIMGVNKTPYLSSN